MFNPMQAIADAKATRKEAWYQYDAGKISRGQYQEIADDAFEYIEAVSGLIQSANNN